MIINNELERILQEVVVASFKVLFWHLLVGLSKTTEYPITRVGDSAKI
jgi:hypothetical protein